MTPHATHDFDELSDLIDDRLPAERRSQVEERLRSCDACLSAFEAMKWARSQAARLAAAPDTPQVEAMVRAALARPDARLPRGTARVRFPWLAAAAALLLVAAGYVALRHRVSPQSRAGSGLPRAVAADFEALRDGRLSLDVVTREVSRLEAHFASRDLGFPARVLDLQMMGYTLQGGREGELEGRRSALFVYRGPAGELILCQMLRGRIAELPSPSARRTHDGIPFLVYEQGETVLVFWPEGDLLCVLVGQGYAETVVQLAFAKAMKASAASAPS